MVSFDYKIMEPGGMHARPASGLVKEASQFQCNIFIYKDNHSADAKSILNLMALAIKKGDQITLILDGADEEEAKEILKTYFELHL